MKTGTLLALVLLTTVSAHAGGSPGAKCAAAKIKAATKKAAAKGACYAKAVAAGSSVDGGCLSKAEEKFTAAFMKAESHGGCATTGDSGTIEAKVNAFVADVVSELPAATTTSTSTTTSSTTTTTCVPLTTCPGGDNCGTIPDGCGGTVSCGSCTAPDTCGGGGTPNVCGCTDSTFMCINTGCPRATEFNACGQAVPCGFNCPGGTPKCCGDSCVCATCFCP